MRIHFIQNNRSEIRLNHQFHSFHPRAKNPLIEPLAVNDGHSRVPKTWPQLRVSSPRSDGGPPFRQR